MWDTPPNLRGNNVLAYEKQKRLRGLLMDGKSMREAAREVGCHHMTAMRYYQQLRDDLRNPDQPNDPAVTTDEIIARGPLYFYGLPLNKGRDWTEADKEIVRTLCVNGKTPKICANVLGRKAKAVAWRAKLMGLRLPSAWTRLL